MTVEELTQALESRGWEVEVASQADVADLVSVDSSGLMKCVDGRLSDKPDQMRGPKTLGGVYAIVASRAQTDLESLKAAIKEVSEAGYVPSVHGDDHNDAMGCGFFKLWVTGKLDGLEQPAYTAEEVKL